MITCKKNTINMDSSCTLFFYNGKFSLIKEGVNNRGSEVDEGEEHSEEEDQ